MSDFHALQRAAFQAYGEERYDELLRLANQGRDEFPQRDATVTFWAACALSLLDRPDEAVQTLEEGERRGLFWAEEILREDEDLARLRGRADFEALIERSDAAAGACEDEAPEPVVMGEGPRGSLVALHGSGQHPDDAEAAWSAAKGRGMQVIVPASRRRFSNDGFTWNKETFATDVRLILEAVNAQAPVVAGGFSQGATFALASAAAGELPVRGVIAVAPGFREHSSRSLSLDEFRSKVSAGAPTRAFVVAGALDELGKGVREAVEAMAAAGHHVHLEFRDELAHSFPDDFEDLLGTALDFVLGDR
jgi:predicted esterase